MPTKSKDTSASGSTSATFSLRRKSAVGLYSSREKAYAAAAKCVLENPGSLSDIQVKMFEKVKDEPEVLFEFYNLCVTPSNRFVIRELELDAPFKETALEKKRRKKDEINQQDDKTAEETSKKSTAVDSDDTTPTTTAKPAARRRAKKGAA